MKILIKYFSVLFIALCLFNCEDEDHFIESNIRLVPVISLTDITPVVDDNPSFNQNGLDISYKPFAINIYKEKPLVINYTSNVNVISYDPIDLVNNSTESIYNITYSATDSTISDDEEIVNSYNYTINYDRTATEPVMGLTIDITTVTTTISLTNSADVQGTQTITDTDENSDVMSDAVITIVTTIDSSNDTTTKVRTRTSTVNYRLLVAEQEVYN